MKTTTALAFLSMAFCYTSSGLAATFDWATIGNPGNAADTTGFGAVVDTYRMSKHEVTNEQYADFLNAIDAVGTNPNAVYNVAMGSQSRGGIAFSSGAANGSKYSLKTNMGNKPVNYVSFFDTMRFVNWLENGQPTDGSGTESGVYVIGNGSNEIRASAAQFFLPSEDEWYKAAYFDPRSAAQGGPAGDDNYWLYPTSSDTAPSIATASAIGDITNPGTNVANYSSGADWNSQNGNVTTVGSANAGSTSFFGTFDQAGNVSEWNETLIGSFNRGRRGGSWGSASGFLASSTGVGLSPTVETAGLGFRIASVAVPEPSSLLLGALAAVGMLVRRRALR